MPIYEGIGLINEKPTVILDIGNAYTKCGFAGDSSPMCIIPSTVFDPQSKKKVNIRDYTSPDHLYCLLSEFINRLYFKFLLVNPKDRRLVIIESVFTPSVFRETLAKLMFIQYEVSSVVFAPSHLMTLYTLGVRTALVMDVGYDETTVIPVYEGVVMINSSEDYAVAGKALHNRLRSLLIEHSTVKMAGNVEAGVETILDFLDEEILEDIKVRACFVTPFERSKALAKGEELKQIPPFNYPLLGSKILSVDGIVRELTMESLFERDGEEKSLASMILNCILKSPIDMRRALAENIIIVGGSSMVPGFQHRLLMEIKHLLSEPRYKSKLALKTFKFHTPPAKENYVSWLGAAIFAASDNTLVRSITREQYLQQSLIPCWSNCSRPTFKTEKSDGVLDEIKYIK
ncbi:Actin- protein 10 [Chamberlinius hualienensis]